MQHLIEIKLSSLQDLAEIYIKQFKFGGVFVSGQFYYKIKDQVKLRISLLDANEVLELDGVIDWLTPETSLDYPVGVGLHFGHDKLAIEIRGKIESILKTKIVKSSLIF